MLDTDIIIGSNNNLSTGFSPVTVIGSRNTKNGSWGVVVGNNNSVLSGDNTTVF